MPNVLRRPTLDTLGLGGVLDVFKRGALPIDAKDAVEAVFGRSSERGSLVISGANGIVGAGKTMQLGSRLEPLGVRVIALDVAGAPDGIGRQYQGLVRAFGTKGANRVMQNIVRLSYDGKHLPDALEGYRPRFLLEAIPEVLDLKRAHYDIFRKTFPEIEIRSVTSGFPAEQLGVGVAHPAFPHEINKVFEIVEPNPSASTKMLWALGLIPVPVSDDWSFVLDVLFCGLTLAALRYHRATNMPYWKIDKYTRKHVGPNPFRAHDAIGAKGANFLTWSCLHHLSKEYGGLFAPTADLVERKDSGQNWYPPNHFRPVVNWSLDAEEEDELVTWVLGALFQMTSIMLQEQRSHFAHLNIIGELCAQFTRGVLALARSHGTETVLKLVTNYHELYPESAKSPWYPAAFENMDSVDWQQLYVNGEHDGTVGVITIARESYNADVDAELNRTIDWLKAQRIERVILSGDFHLATQLVGADTNEFFPALDDEAAGFEISHAWSKTARRLHDEFATSVGFVGGKRCWGGCLELMLHCHYLVAVEGATFAFPEVTLPVVPGMEACHWPFRKAPKKDRPRLLDMILQGKPVGAQDATEWLVDYAGPLTDALAAAWRIASGKDTHPPRKLEEGPIEIANALSSVAIDNPNLPEAQRAILDSIHAACEVTLAEALTIQARHSAGFMRSDACRRGAVGAAMKKTLAL